MLKELKKVGTGVIIRISTEDLKCHQMTVGDVIDVKISSVPKVDEEKKDYTRGWSSIKIGGGTDAEAEKCGWEYVVEGRKERAEFEKSEKKIREGIKKK